MPQYTIYQAGPLFTDAERQWHRATKDAMENAGMKVDVIWPGELLTGEQIDAAGADAPSLIFKVCKDALDDSDMVVALLDGTQVDDGTAWEIGYAYAKGKRIYGIRTDSRVAGDTKFSRVNGMIEGCLSGLARTVPELVSMITRWRLEAAIQ